MCGIAGFVNPSNRAFSPELETIALTMAAALRHRGPDDEGVWAEPESGVGLSHRRLSIQDLSEEGHQPMRSPCGRYVLVFNGEIYNFLDLRAELEKKGHRFRGHSDTEVMLAAFSEMGIEQAIQHFSGMFAFAVWDRELRRLHLARDRAGEKPLYYGWSGGVFLFGSELKALQAHPFWKGELDLVALGGFMRHDYIPAPRSIYRGVLKLLPGCILTLGAPEFSARTSPAPARYWSLWSVARAGLDRPFQGSASEAMERLRGLLERAIRRQMIADVPVGAFLSGGVDSSTVVAMMQAQSSRPVRTFSIGFEEQDYNEAPFAKAVASHLGTQHTELYVQASTLRAAIPRLPAIYDEPFACTSHVPTLLLCELARKHVTVCLTGDGGDELFGGYGMYRRTQQVWGCLRRIPLAIRLPLARWSGAAGRLGVEIQSRLGSEPRRFKRLSRLSDLLRTPDDQSLYQLHVSVCRDPEQWLIKEGQPYTDSQDDSWNAFPELLQRMMYWDFIHYLPDEVLTKVDRASMSVSLESRIPLLDHEIVEFAWSLPGTLRQRAGQGKWLLRELLHQYVPRSLVERPKQGFAMPVEEWIRGELRPWAEDLLEENRLRQDGLFRAQTVRQKWSEHLARKGDWGQAIWNVLMFQGWLEAQRSREPSHPAQRTANQPCRSVEKETPVSAR